jgi:hypothetical protein
MDERERPNLTLGRLATITDGISEADQAAWDALRPLLKPRGWNDNTRFKGPRPPKLTARFYLILANYANELFHTEANEYPRYPPSGYFPNWLRNLAQRLEAHVIAVVKDVEASDSEKSFSYHGVVEKEMRSNIRQRLHAEIESRYNVKYLTSALEVLVEILEPLATPPTPYDALVRRTPQKVVAPTPPQTVAPTAAPIFGTELRRLLEEAEWKPEDIAEKIGIDSRTVYRHLNGSVFPTPKTRWAYQGALRERLKKKVVLPKSSKRQ